MSVAFSLEQSLGDRIAKGRRLARLTQAELALRMGVSRQLVAKWERDASEPSASQVVQLAVVYRDAGVEGADVLWLLDLAPITTCFGHPSLSLVEFPRNDQMELPFSGDSVLDNPYVTLVTTGA